MAKDGGMIEIIIVIALIGGFLLLWPQISSGLGGIGAGAVQTDTSGGGKADASDSGGGAKAGGGDDEDDCTNVRDARAMAECIREKTRRMIGRTGRRTRGGIRQFNRGGSGTNVHMSGKGGGAIACVNGKCTSAYGEMGLPFSNVI